jgi:hypothetical protein
MMWYWYFTGMATVLFLQSILLNIGLAKGWVRFVGRRPEFTAVRLYDQDNSGSYKRAG